MNLKKNSGLEKDLESRFESKMTATASDQEQIDKSWCKIRNKNRCAEHYHHIKSIDLSVK